MADDYNWDDFDTQTAEYLSTDPTWANYEWSPDQSSWLSDYTAPLFPEMIIGAQDTPLLDLQSYLNSPSLEGVMEFGGYMPTELSGFGTQAITPYQDSYYDVASAYEQATGLPIEQRIETMNGQDYVVDETGDVLGFRDDSGNIQYYSDIANQSQAKAQPAVNWSQRAKDATAEAMARAYEARNRQAAAKDAYSRSGVGQAMTGLQGALAVAQALMGKNKGVTTSSRGNQGQAFAPTYIGSSAPKTKYARGGEVKGGLLNLAEQMAHMMASQKGLIPGEAGGQDDVVDIKAAPGEYVMDAEVVSALGDGNNEEGARKLDKMRFNIRKHKRSGGLSSIPPKAKKPEQYVKGK